jgi:hypothetical protein
MYRLQRLVKARNGRTPIERKSRLYGTQPAVREYFYWLDMNGRLYCISESQQTMPVGQGYLRDEKALNFYFSRYA